MEEKCERCELIMKEFRVILKGKRGWVRFGSVDKELHKIWHKKRNHEILNHNAPGKIDFRFPCV